MTTETPTTLPFDNDTLTEASGWADNISHGTVTWTTDNGSGLLDDDQLALLRDRINAGEITYDSRFSMESSGSSDDFSAQDTEMFYRGIAPVTVVCGTTEQPSATFLPSTHMIYLGTNGKFYMLSNGVWTEMLTPPPYQVTQTFLANPVVTGDDS